MTATDELRRLLDDRGVKYVAEDEPSVGLHFTSWDADGFMWEADDRDERIYLSADRLITPEQAIAATLGSSNCTNSERTETCHDKNGFDPEMGFECTVCGAMVDRYMVTPADTGHEVQLKFCPNCGRRIVQEVDE